MTQTKLQFFKDTLNEFLKLKQRNDEYNDMANKILENDMTKDFPVYLSDSFCFPYETLVIDSLAQLWNEPKYVLEGVMEALLLHWLIKAHQVEQEFLVMLLKIVWAI